MIVSKATGQLLVPYHESLEAFVSDGVKTIEHEDQVFAVLPHTPRTQMQLRSAGIDAPAPILFHYDWASSDGATPFAVQKHTASLATSHLRSYVLNDMGTGKTKSALWSWKFLFMSGAAKKLLVVCPLSTMKFVWLKELRITMPEVKAAVLHGTREQRLKLLDSQCDVYIINHDGLKSIARTHTSRSRFNGTTKLR